MKNSKVAASFLGALIGLVIVFVVVAWIASDWNSTTQAAVLLIAAIALLVGLLGLLAVAFSALGLSDRSQALGLPEGSVRAVIALMLLVIVGSMTVFIYSGMETDARRAEAFCPATDTTKSDTTKTDTTKVDTAKTDTTKTDTTKTDTTKTDTKGTASTSNTTVRTLTTETSTTTSNSSSAANDTSKTIGAAKGMGSAQNLATSTATPSADQHRQANDLARELLIMLGTLLTSVCSFYFGSRTAQGASGASAPPPQISGVNPRSLKASDTTVKGFEVDGTGLLNVDRVKITHSGATISGTGVVSNATVVKCDLPIMATTPTGLWDVAVGTPDGAWVTLAGAVTIS